MDEKTTIIILGNKFNRAIYDAAHLCYDIFGDYQQRKVTDADEIDSLKTDKIHPPLKKTGKKIRR